MSARILPSLVLPAQRSLEAETLQKVAQGRVDLQKMKASTNELRSFEQCSPKHFFVPPQSAARLWPLLPCSRITLQLKHMLRYTDKLYELF